MFDNHGWTEHGHPCCASAPLALRPDAVMACSQTWPPLASGQYVTITQTCAACLAGREAIHNPVMMPFTTAADFVRGLRERNAADYERLFGPRATSPSFTIITGGW